MYFLIGIYIPGNYLPNELPPEGTYLNNFASQYKTEINHGYQYDKSDYPSKFAHHNAPEYVPSQPIIYHDSYYQVRFYITNTSVQ